MSFILLKPDAGTMTRLRYIVRKMKDLDIRPVKKHKVRLNKAMIFSLWEKEPIIDDVLLDLNEYLSGLDLTLVIVEGDEIYRKLAELKADVRSEFGCMEGIYNVLHTPDSSEASRRELSILRISV